MEFHSIASSARCWRCREHVEAERLGGLEVDHQVELRGLKGRAAEAALGRLGRFTPVNDG
jgi:hypothetical protein